MILKLSVWKRAVGTRPSICQVCHWGDVVMRCLLTERLRLPLGDPLVLTREG